MLHEFVAENRDAIIAIARKRVEERPWPPVEPRELEFGVPMFLTQLVETLKLEANGKKADPDDGKIGEIAARHGGELRGAGFNVSQVVHDYGDICQSVTELAVKRNATITIEEFHTLNRCLDTAIAEAVTEHARITAQTGASEEVERLGHAAHELRDILNTALLAFHMLRRGTAAINGSTGEVLGRSLMGLREVIDRTLSEVRLTAGRQLNERLPVVALVDEIATSGVLHAEYRHVKFTVGPVDPTLAIEGDPHLIASAVMNLLHNAFKNTPAGGHVMLRAHAERERLVVEVEDQCGGLSTSRGDPFDLSRDRRGTPRSGVALGLSVARKSMKAHGGDITIRNMPGKGCIFVLEMPLAAEEGRAPQPLGNR